MGSQHKAGCVLPLGSDQINIYVTHHHHKKLDQYFTTNNVTHQGIYQEAPQCVCEIERAYKGIQCCVCDSCESLLHRQFFFPVFFFFALMYISLCAGLNFDLQSVHKLEKYVLEFHPLEKAQPVMSGDWVIFKMSEIHIGLVRFVPPQKQVFNHS